jgi:hypothetical protein
MNPEQLKMQAARTLRMEDVVLLDLTTDFSLDEIEDAYHKMMDHTKLIPDQNSALIGRAILAIGMSVVVRSLTEKKIEGGKNEP